MFSDPGGQAGCINQSALKENATSSLSCWNEAAWMLR